MALTPRQMTFIEEYMINGFNATQAAITAGYSKKTANEQAARLLANISVKSEIERLQRSIADEYPLLRKRTIERVKKIAFSDIKDYLSFKTVKVRDGESNGEPLFTYKTVIELKDSDDVDGGLISEVSETRDGFKFKRLDPLKALELLGRFTGLENAELDDIRRDIREIKENTKGGG